MRLAALVLSAAGLASAQSTAAPEAVARLQQKTAALPAGLAFDFRMLAAQSLQKTQPELASKLVRQTLDEFRSSKGLRPGWTTVRLLAEMAPQDAASALPQESRPELVSAYLNARRPVEAAAVFRQLLIKERAPLALAGPLIGQLARVDKADAVKLFIEITGAIDAESAPLEQVWRLVEASNAIAPFAPANAVAAVESVIRYASSPDYFKPGSVEVLARFGPSQPPLTASDSRESFLMAAGSVLARAAPARLAAFQSVLGKWPNLADLRLLSVNIRVAGVATQPPNPALAAISKRLSPYRSLPTDADRAKLALEIVAELETLPPADRYGPALSLSHVITEGDMGKPALTAVARAYANGILAAGNRAGIDDWTHLAGLIRYEHLQAPISSPTLDAAMALLDVRESILQDASFSLSSMDGKSYSLDALHGKIVLLNFWATWCPPCRKEMPDMEKLYREFNGKGFVVLAVSDEDRETVAGYLAKQTYTFPVLLDPDRKVHTAFDVEGIPKSFLFDRTGKLAGQTIDMRTESQFREMLKGVGLE